MKDFVIRHKWPLIVAAAAVVARLVYLYELSLQPGFTVPMVDEKWHWEWAHKILEESFWGEGAYFRGPLYPYLLALLAKLTGSSIFWTKSLQVLLSGGTAAFTYLLAARLFGHTAGIVAGLGYAFYGTLVFYETMFLIPALFLFFLVWGMYRVVAFSGSQSARAWLFTGLIFGLAAISRPNVLLVVPALMIWMYFANQVNASFFRRTKMPLVLLAGVVIAIVPVTARNLIVTGDFILISSQGGINFYLGNNEYADGMTMIMPEVSLDESVSWRRFGLVTKAAAEKEAGRELSEAELSSFWTAKATDFILSNPGKFLTLVWKKIAYLVSGFENSDNNDLYYQRTKSWLYSVLLWHRLLYFPFGVLLPLAIAGVYLRRDSLRQLLPLYVFIAAYIPTIVLFLVTARHRLPLVPFLIIIAAGGVAKFVSERKKMPARALGITLLTLSVCLFAFNRTFFEAGSQSAFQIHFNNGIKFERLNDIAGAEKEYLLADEAYPYSASLITSLAYAQFRLGKHEVARSNYYRAIGLKPDYPRSYNNLGVLFKEQNMLDSALACFQMAIARYDTATSLPDEIGQIYLNMAETWEGLGELDSAAAAYDEAIRATPDMASPCLKAAAFFARHGEHVRADSLFSDGMHKQGDLSATDFFNWGLSLIERKRLSDGLSMMVRALKRDPTLHQAYYCIGVVYYEGGEVADSVCYYLDKCLELDPEYEPALSLKKLLKETEP